MITEFPTAKDFADFISSSCGRKNIIRWNKQNGEERIYSLASRFEFMWRYDYLHDALLEGTMYGLRRFIRTGRASSASRKALFAMNTRQLCMLIYELAQQTHDIEEHCRILNARYAIEDGGISPSSV